MLTELVRRAGEARERPLPPEQASELAAALARLIDQVETERLTFAKLVDLAPADLAAHWRETVEFLEIVTEAWPAIEREAGGVGPAAHRNRLLEAQAERWRREPPGDSVIVAGSTGSIPATADLIATVATLPAGRVVLGGLERMRDAEYRSALAADPSHPQHGLVRLLDRLGLAPDAVRPWPVGAPAPAVATRIGFLGEALLPAPLTDRWTRRSRKTERERLLAALAGAERADATGRSEAVGFRRIDCANEQEEALAIALLLREAIETTGRRAALVTPDRGLARRVAAELRRWDIAIDDSAGLPLGETPPGALLRLVAAAAADAAPVPMLALLKHPLVACGSAPARFRARVRRLERAALRGARPAPGLAGIAVALRAAARRDTGHRALLPWFARLQDLAEPFFALVGRERVAVAELARAHGALAEALAATDREPGAARLWSGDAGEAAASFVEELVASAGAAGPIAGRDYAALFDALIQPRVARPGHGRHPRLFIWGLLEARLQQADLVVLGGLNEGSWPPEPAVDPWMSRPMRESFGLPSAERRIGQSALDFLQAAAAPVAVLTRALKVDGQPTVPARWLTRIDALLKSKGLEPAAIRGDLPYLGWVAALDRPRAIRPEQRPAPCPPVELRPRKLSVTEIETWMRDPYAIYARHVLGLRPLDPIDASPDAATRGEAIHRALERFLERHPQALPADPPAELLEIGAAVFGDLLDRPSVRSFWWPRFERIAHWFVAERRTGLARIDRSFSERKGSIEIDAPAGRFRLTAKADRIDRLRDGRLAVVDYKTGSLPKAREIELGFAPQLPLEAAIAAAGGFDGIAAAPIAALAHWRLSGGDPAGEIEPVAGDLDELAAAALAGLAELVRRFDAPATPYLPRPNPAHAPRFSDYAHLARVKAWSAGGEEAGE
jgi:ATP-dependent helicase/nuclease subunit B